MVYFHIQEELELYYEESVITKNNSSSPTERFHIKLYRILVISRVAISVRKRPAVKIFTDDNIEIPQSSWTSEMKELTSQKIIENPVTRFRKIKPFWKAFMLISAFLITFSLAAFIYELVIIAPERQREKANFESFTMIGDRFYVSLEGGKYDRYLSRPTTWMIIESINKIDSTLVIILNSEMNAHTFEPLTREHHIFDGDRDTVFFFSKSNEVVFKKKDQTSSMISRVFGHKYQNVKIPAKKDTQ